MKKHVLFLLISFITVSSTQAFDIESAGIRAGFGGEFSARIPYKNQRIETDLGIWGRGKAMTITGVYQWTGGLDDITPGLNWFAGPGAQIMLGTDIVNLGVLGQAGLDYRIPGVPLSVSLDYRPCLFSGKNSGFDGAAFALGIRYCF